MRIVDQFICNMCIIWLLNSLSSLVFFFLLLLLRILPFICRSISGVAMFNVTAVWGVCYAYKKFNHITVPFVTKAIGDSSIRRSIWWICWRERDGSLPFNLLNYITKVLLKNNNKYRQNYQMTGQWPLHIKASVYIVHWQ